jgi:curved DNA-binding protein CbpA
MNDEIDYYKILGLDPKATQAQIKARYKTLANKYHPDHDGDDSLMSLINDAYNILNNPTARQHYDNKKRPSNNTNTTKEQSAQSEPPKTSPKPNTTAPPTSNKQKHTVRAKQLSKKSLKQRELVSGVVVLALIIMIVIFAHKSPATNNSLNLTPTNSSTNQSSTITIPVDTNFTPPSDPEALQLASDVVASKNQYYNPAEESTYPNSYELYFSNNCLSDGSTTYPGFAGYSQSQQIRFCGCTLAVLEQNYSYSQAAQLQQEVNSGTPATSLDNLDIQDCSSVV